MVAERKLVIPIAKMADIQRFLGVRPHSQWHPLLKQMFGRDVELDLDSTVLYPHPHKPETYRVMHPNEGWVNLSPLPGKTGVEHLSVQLWHMFDSQLTGLFTEDQIQHWRKKK